MMKKTTSNRISRISIYLLIACLIALTVGISVSAETTVAQQPVIADPSPAAYVAQKNETFPCTVFDCVLMGRRPHIKCEVGREDLELTAAMISRMGLEALQLRRLDELSGGELQKVLLARALVRQPKILLLDEPTSNLDPKNQYEMMALVRQIAKEQGITVLIVIHDLNLALRYCDRFFFLKDGTGYRYGGTECVDRETIETVYGISARIAEMDDRKIVIIG